MTKLSVSIVMYQNDLKMLEGTIRSAMSCQDTPDLNIRLLLVDNSPSDERKNLVGIDSRVEYQSTGKNLGFGSGHNIAFRHFDGWSDYHLVLNPDISFGPDALPALTVFMDKNVNTGLCMPKILNPSGSLQYACKLLPTPTNLILRRLPFLKAWTQKSDELYEMKKADYSKPMVVPFLSGCFMLLRMSTLRTVGFFDERYFLYLEDTDLCRRFLEVSDTCYVPFVSITHEAQRESAKNRQLLKIHIQSAIRYFNKWGWFFDRKRRLYNCRAIRAYHL